jgi:hypothetical protein
METPMSGKNPDRVALGRQGGLQSWVNSDKRNVRHQRMGKVRVKSPAADEYWASRLGFEGPVDKLTPEQRAQIKTQLEAEAQVEQARA